MAPVIVIPRNKSKMHGQLASRRVHFNPRPKLSDTPLMVRYVGTTAGKRKKSAKYCTVVSLIQ